MQGVESYCSLVHFNEILCCHVFSEFCINTRVVANDADVKSSEQDSVLSEREANGIAHELVHTESKPELCETQSKQLASSSEVIVDSDSVYSVCCSDVTTDTADIVHVDHATLPVPGMAVIMPSTSSFTIHTVQFVKLKHLF